MVELIIITGFLGAGKTTLLNQLVGQSQHGKKTGIVQNEFAPIRVKGELLELPGNTYPVMEVNNGSVFCVCRLSHFTSDFSRFIAQHKPDRVFLEASGLSDPSSLAEILNDPRLSDRVRLHAMICVADATMLGKTDKMVRYVRQQLMLADSIILNKMDALGDDGKEQLEPYIRSLNPHAAIIPATYCNVRIGDVLKQRENQSLPMGHSTRPDVRSMVLRTAKTLSREGMYAFLQEFSPKAYRIKGLIKTDKGLCSIQCVRDQIETRLLEGREGNTELIAITDAFTLGQWKKGYETFMIHHP